MKRVLLTGATGFVGRHCIAPLVDAGYEVHCVSRMPCPELGGTWYGADLLEQVQIKSLLANVQPSHLLHLAWDVRPEIYWTSLGNYQWVSSSLELLQAFVENGGQRVCVAGTCAEYDWSAGLCAEYQTPCVPTTAYGICKYALYTMLNSFGTQIPLSTVWARLFYIYGRFEKPGRLVPTAVRALLDNQPFLCTGGSRIRDFLYVEDAASALVALLDSSVTGAVNVASGVPVTLKEVVLTIGRQLDREQLIQFGALAESPDAPSEISAKIERLANEVGWTPRFSLETGIARSIDWWRQELKGSIKVSHVK